MASKDEFNKILSIKTDLNILSPAQLEIIHEASINTLEKVGIKIGSDKAVHTFEDAGAKIEYNRNYCVAKVPRYIVESCIDNAPAEYMLCGRDPQFDYLAKPGRAGHSTFGECIQIIDPLTREIRKSTKEDLANYCRLCDSFDEIKVMVRPLCPTDKHPSTQPLHSLDAMLHNTSKHILIGAHKGINVEKMYQIAVASAGGLDAFKQRPHLTINTSPTSPLSLGKDCCEIIMEAARLGLGLVIIPMPLAGATSPATLPGTLVMQNVETLAGIILAQLTRKGTPCIYSSAASIMDLKQMVGSFGSPEQGLLTSAAIKLAQYYRLPSLVCGGTSDSKSPDAQSGYEFTMNSLLCSLAGGNIIIGAGALELGLTIDYAKFLFDIDMIAYITKIIDGFSMSEEQIAAELISQNSHRGEFLTSEHTFLHMREQSNPRFFCRKNRIASEESVQNNSLEKAYQTAQTIINNHKPTGLPPFASDEIKAIIGEFENELRCYKNSRNNFSV